MRTVDKIVKQFTKTIAELNHAAENNMVLEEKALARVAEARKDADYYGKEQQRARKFAENIGKLLNEGD